MDNPSHWVTFLNYIFFTQWVCPQFTQNWVKTTQHFLECNEAYTHSKKCWVISTQIWVKYGKSKCWVKNVIKNVQLKVKVLHDILAQHLGLSTFYPILG